MPLNLFGQNYEFDNFDNFLSEFQKKKKKKKKKTDVDSIYQ